MYLPQAVILFVAALVAGTLNSVAGGGSTITLPTLIFTGVPPVQSSSTNSVALWPGSVASAVAFRDALDASRATLLALGLPSVVGGLLGAELLLHTPQRTFLLLVPYLLLLATLLFAFGGRITNWARARIPKGRIPPWVGASGLGLMQLVIATYGGFFGGGIGILMLALLAIAGMRNIHAMNALKNLLASLINGVAIIVFIITGAVYWPEALVMVVGAVVGGYGGASLARRLDPRFVRAFVILVGVTMAAYFFYRYGFA